MMAQKSAHREGLTTLREARRLGIPVILLTNALDSRFSKDASIVIHVPRGDERGKTPRTRYGIVVPGNDCLVGGFRGAAACG